MTGRVSNVGLGSPDITLRRLPAGVGIRKQLLQPQEAEQAGTFVWLRYKRSRLLAFCNCVAGLPEPAGNLPDRIAPRLPCLPVCAAPWTSVLHILLTLGSLSSCNALL